MKVKEFIEGVGKGEIDVVKNTDEILARTLEIDKEFNHLNVISNDLAKELANNLGKNSKGKVAGLPISVKDSIVVKDVESTGGSAILKGYIPLFDATAVRKLKEEGAIIIGKTAQDEFGHGSFSTNVNESQGFRIPLNPFDKDRSCGGSSGGAAGFAQKADFPHVALGESTGGSIVCPASFCGVFGLCPTYGRISRYGLIDYGNSLDKIGPIGKSIYDVALVLEVMAGYDKEDSTSLNVPVDNYTNYVGKDIKGMKVGVVRDYFKEGTDKVVIDKVNLAIEKIKKAGADVSEVSLPLVSKYALPCYYMLASSETSTNLAKFCGMRYGKHESLKGESYNDYFTRIRSKYISIESRRRILIGTFTRMAGHRDAYYIKATKVRTLIIKEYKDLFKKYDVLINPTMPFVAPKFAEIEKLTQLQEFMSDIMICGPNLAGLPHLNVPVGVDDSDGNNMPIGMLVVADHLNEGKLVQLGSLFDEDL
ncbi:amidase family protein [Nanoarchaeota archaeon]